MTKKIFHNMLVVGFSTVVITAVLITAFFFGTFENQIKKDLKEETKSIIVAINSGVDIKSYQNQNARITLIDKNGEVIFDNKANVSKNENHLSRPEVKEALEHGEGQDVRKSSTMNSTTYYYAMITDDSEILRVSLKTSSIIAMFLKTFYLTIILSVVIILLSFALSYKLAKKIVKPIEKITEDLDNITQSPYEELKPFTDKIKIQRAEEKRLSKIKREFTANISHELKTPLTSISGYSEMIANGMVANEDVEKIGGIIYKESNRLMNLTHDIIQLSQLEEYDFKPIIDFVDLYEIVKSTVETLSVKAKKKNVEIIFNGSKTIAKGTKPLIEELSYNIIENAIKYNIENGKVYINVYSENEMAVLDVSDTGIGIPKKYQERVFERFFRVDKSRSKETGGTGLGLAIVKHTVDYLKGELSIKSEEGKGTNIVVKLKK